MKQTQPFVTVVRAVAALVATVVLVAGVPLALVRLVGWPLPTRLPSLAQVQAALDLGLPDGFWLKLFAVVVWLAWLQLVAALVRELIARVRGRAVRPRLGDVWAQTVAARLIGAIALAATVIGPSSAASGQPLPDAVAALSGRSAAMGAAPTYAPAPIDAPAEPGASTTHTVERGESLSSIAADELGDQAAWPRIWTANRGRSFGARVFRDPNLILPGWDLQVPTAEPEVAPVTRTGGAGPLAAAGGHGRARSQPRARSHPCARSHPGARAGP